MALFSVDTRELRSFRFRHRIEELRSVIENNKTDVVFCISNSLNPVEREELRADLNKYEIIVTSLSKNIIRFLFLNSNWKDVRSLLEGQIFLIKNKNNSKPNNQMSHEFLSTLVGQNDKFVLRLFVHNQQLYRREHLKRLLVAKSANRISSSNENKPAILPLLLLRQFLVERSLISLSRKPSATIFDLNSIQS